MRLSKEDYYAFTRRQQSSNAKPVKQNKYRAKKTWMDGICFDSRKEAAYYEDCKILVRAGELDGFIYHGKMVCVEGTDKDDRAALYEPDFVLFYPEGTYRVVDVKSEATITNEFKLKMKALRAKYPRVKIEIET